MAISFSNRRARRKNGGQNRRDSAACAVAPHWNGEGRSRPELTPNLRHAGNRVNVRAEQGPVLAVGDSAPGSARGSSVRELCEGRPRGQSPGLKSRWHLAAECGALSTRRAPTRASGSNSGAAALQVDGVAAHAGAGVHGTATRRRPRGRCRGAESRARAASRPSRRVAASTTPPHIGQDRRHGRDRTSSRSPKARAPASGVCGISTTNSSWL